MTAGGCSTLAGQPLPEASLCSVVKLEQWGNIGNRLPQRASALTLSFPHNILVNLIYMLAPPALRARRLEVEFALEIGDEGCELTMINIAPLPDQLPKLTQLPSPQG